MGGRHRHGKEEGRSTVLRLCIDFRELNNQTILDSFPLPRIDDTVTRLGPATYFTTIDVWNAFWQVGLLEADRPKTAFATREGLFQWTRMPFDLCNATATFHRLMTKVLQGIPQKEGDVVLCYVDDILIATTTIEQHLVKLNQVLQRLTQAGLKCKSTKCDLLKREVTFLGRVIGGGRITPDPSMYSTLAEWNQPRTKKELQSFLGFVKYYREFVKGLSEMAHPLKELTRPNKPFEFKPEHVECFEKVRRALIGALLLHQPTEDGYYILDTDASDVAIAGVLCQIREKDGVKTECPIAFGSKSLSETEMRYGAPKAEMLAAVYFIEKYRPYLTRGTFTLRTDNHALSWLRKYSMTRGMTARWIQRLDQYKFVVEHRKRERHQNVDSLSKKTEFYIRREDRDANLPSEMPNFRFLVDPTQFDELPPLDLDIEKSELNEIELHTRHPAHCEWDSEVEKESPQEWIFAMSATVPPQEQQDVFAVAKDYAAHRYRISDLIRAQENDIVIKSLRLLSTGWKGRLPTLEAEGQTRVRAYFSRFRDCIYQSTEGVLMRRRRVEDSPAKINDLILLPALFQMEALHLAHDGQSHVGETKTIHTILTQFDWPGLHKDVAKYVNSCLTCQCSKPAKQRMKFPLKPIHSGAPNELLQIDHGKLSTTKDGHLGVLMMIDHFTKFAVAAPYRLCDAQEIVV